MKTYSIPVVITMMGWIEIKADDLAAAKLEGIKLNEEGVDFLHLKDSSCESEVMVDEIEEFS